METGNTLMTKTADAQIVEAAVERNQLNDKKSALCRPALTVARGDLSPA